MSGWVKFLLGLANMPQATIEELEHDMPAIGRLYARAKEAQPLLEELLPLIEKAQPLIEKLLPIAVKAMPDVKEITPTIGDIIDFVKAKQG